jgi:hypothetical protein
MNEKDFITLMHDVKRHEDALMEDAKEIRGLKVDGSMCGSCRIS